VGGRYGLLNQMKVETHDVSVRKLRSILVKTTSYFLLRGILSFVGVGHSGEENRSKSAAMS
jgi:hypothetical protein